MKRRDFLHPRRIAHTAGQVLGALDLTPANESASPDSVSLLHARRRAMATDFEIILPFGTPHALDAAEAGFERIDQVEDQLTVYRDSSEVSAINRRAASEAVPLSPSLFDLLSLAGRITNETKGAFDVSVGALIKAWGFYRRRGRVPSAAERSEVLQRTGMCHLRLNADARTVRFLRPGVELNFGSIGKGYALDCVNEILRQTWKIPAALLHGGHSSVYAIGSQPGERNGWRVGVRHPWDPTRRLAVVRLRDRGLATSAATFQHLEHQGRKLGHVLDPRTGWPAETLASATALAPSAAEADALSTAFFILGVEAAGLYCQAHPRVGAILLPAGEGAAPVVLGLAPEEVSLSP